MKTIIPQKIRNIYHLCQAILANFIYGFPSKSIKIIGITGTNGKTTTCQMVAKILEEAGFKVAMNSTINFKIGEKEWVNKTKFTTLSSFKVQEFILDAVKAKCDYLILETSSHSLDQYRVWGVKFDTAVITNVTREHLDYHKNMEKYRKAKYLLFRNINTAIINLDMENPEEYLNCGAKNKYGFSIKYDRESIMYKKLEEKYGNLKSVVTENIKLGTKNTSYLIHNTLFLLNLPGLFNVENALAATCVGLSQGVSLEIIAKALGKIEGVLGRMEYVPNSKDLNIIVDYAVTPDSLEKLYGLVKKINNGKNRIIAVFGSCGERDRGKRPIMGEIVSNFADYIILTDEDPYGENPVDIINQVFSGVVGYEAKDDFPNYQLPITNYQTISNNQNSNSKKIEGINCWRILDRREAIKKALLLAKPGDFVVVTGKGAEETMAMGEERIPWNDKKVILEELEKI